MYLNLCALLEGTPYIDRLISAEKLLSSLRGRKSALEIARIRTAVAITEEIYAKGISEIQPGLSEIQVAEMMQAEVIRRGLDFAWPRSNNPAVNSGPDSPVGHNAPTEIRSSAVISCTSTWHPERGLLLRYSADGLLVEAG